MEGKDILVLDDMLSSGDSLLDIATELKRRKARRIFAAVTYAQMCIRDRDSNDNRYEITDSRELDKHSQALLNAEL